MMEEDWGNGINGGNISMADVPLNILRSEVTITIGHNHFTVTKFLERSVLDNRIDQSYGFGIDKKLVLF